MAFKKMDDEMEEYSFEKYLYERMKEEDEQSSEQDEEQDD